MENILFINACVRDSSRTRVIAEAVLKNYKGNIITKNLWEENILPLNKERLCRRNELIAKNKLNDEMFKNAKEFAQADRIIIAAPFWDLGFPALLKIYLESIMVSGISFIYENGIPCGLCRAKSLEYITTSGGIIFEDYGYSYIKSLANIFFGIKQVSCTFAQNLDVDCINADDVLKKAVIQQKN